MYNFITANIKRAPMCTKQKELLNTPTVYIQCLRVDRNGTEN